MNSFDTYVTAYKTASIGDAFIGGLLANSVNATGDDTPSYSDAQVAAMEKDANKRENRIRAMVDAADTDRGHISQFGGGVVGGFAGGLTGLRLGEIIGKMMADKDNPDSKAPAVGGLLGLAAGATGGTLLGRDVIRVNQANRRKDYEDALRRKVKAIAG